MSYLTWKTGIGQTPSYRHNRWILFQ